MGCLRQPTFILASSALPFRGAHPRVRKCDCKPRINHTKTAFFGGRKATTTQAHTVKPSGTRMSVTTAFPALVLRHLGTWEGTYRILDAKSGETLDTHACKIEVGIRGERYAQRNTYTWDDGRQEVYEFPGRMIDGMLRVQSERLDGHVILMDKDAMCFYAKRKDQDYQLYDVIVLLTEDTRARTWSVIQGQEVTQIIQVEESRTSRDDAYFDVKYDPWAS